MQISGLNETDFANFSLDLTATNNCDICVMASGLTASPAPANGFYLPGETVQFCMEVTEYDQIGSNWMSGVVPSLGPMWDASTLTGTSSPPGSGSYEWFWDNGPFGWGWYVDIDPPGGGPGGAPDGNYTNNYGDPSIGAVGGATGSWTFCFEVTASSSCTPGGDLGLTIETYSDYETGGYGVTGCVGDPTVPFTAVMMCCDIPLISSTDETCFGANDGTATVEGQGGTAPYDYVFEDGSGSTVFTDNNNSGPSTATGLAPGTYTVTVTDDNGCVQIIDVVVLPAPLFTVTATATPSLCAGVPCTGTVSSSTTGGAGGISYSWDGGLGAGQNQTNVCAGTFTVTATDGGGCSITDVAIVTAPPLLTVTAGGTAETCDGLCDGTLTSAGAGGTGAISYSWDNGAGGSQNPTGICDGTYTVTATDANGCTVTDTYVVAPGAIITAVIDPIASQCLVGNSFSFNGGNSTISAGSITSYTWNYGDGSGTGSGASPSYTYGSDGTFTVTLTVTDGTCTDVITQNVTVFVMPVVTASGTNISCFGLTDGTVNAVGSGTSGYTYAWDIPAAGAAQTGLGAGAYTVTVTDVNGCTAIDAYTVTEPPLLVVAATGTDASCNGVCDGTLDGTISGGTLAYGISWSGGPSSGTEDQASVCAGAYTLTVTDGNGCVESASYTVTEPPVLTVSSTSTDMLCNGVCDGTLDATVGGGTSGYTYSWDGGPAPGSEDQSSVCAGTFTLTVTDPNGCTITTSSTVVEPPLLTVTVTGTDASCNAVCDGTVSSVVAGGTGSITYAWDNAAG
ncbi:MAG: PKD domain-containing protein, partial [Flavobacteriales bacterium]|nr:PKD domain-containing protein [Flavobacteriales bacterium]